MKSAKKETKSKLKSASLEMKKSQLKSAVSKYGNGPKSAKSDKKPDMKSAAKASDSPKSSQDMTDEEIKEWERKNAENIKQIKKSIKAKMK